MAIPGVAFITKLFAPILRFFGPKGMLVKVFGRFGPLGVLITGFLLLRHYADDIAKALAPALDKLKELIPKLQPVIDFFKRVGDFLIKTLLGTIGDALELVIDAVTGVVEGFTIWPQMQRQCNAHQCLLRGSSSIVITKRNRVMKF